jgi:hypothetical protein
MPTLPDLDAFANYLSLVYHGSRNVRFLIKDGHVAAEPYERARSLPANREAAWVAVQDLRARASRARSVDEASALFANRFSLTLEDLVALYDNPTWKYAQLYGGNRWAAIARAVLELGTALDQHDVDRAAQLLERIPWMRHGTGLVGDKLVGPRRLACRGGRIAGRRVVGRR